MLPTMYLLTYLLTYLLHGFQICLLLFPPEMSASVTSCIVQIIYIALVCVLYPLHFSFLLLLPLALQPTMGFGLSNNMLPFFPICHQLSPSSLNLSSFFICSNFVTISFCCVGLLAPRQTPNLEDQGIPFCLGHHP
jgi:hypothetical protein